MCIWEGCTCICGTESLSSLDWEAPALSSFPLSSVFLDFFFLPFAESSSYTAHREVYISLPSLISTYRSPAYVASYRLFLRLRGQVGGRLNRHGRCSRGDRLPEISHQNAQAGIEVGQLVHAQGHLVEVELYRGLEYFWVRAEGHASALGHVSSLYMRLNRSLVK